MSFCTWFIKRKDKENTRVVLYLGHKNKKFLFQVNLNDEDPNLQELLQAGTKEILIEDFVKYSLDMKLLDVQVRPASWSISGLTLIW